MPYAPEPWQSKAACRSYDPEIWFPNRHDNYSFSRARLICKSCPVLETCLDWAVSRKIEHGIWGGKTAPERRRPSDNMHGTLIGYRRHKSQGTPPCWDCIAAEERRKSRMVCGTKQGYDNHQRARETACRACKLAHAEHARNERARRSLAKDTGQ